MLGDIGTDVDGAETLPAATPKKTAKKPAKKAKGAAKKKPAPKKTKAKKPAKSKPKAKKPTKKAKAKPGPKTYNGELTHRFDMRVTAKDRKKLEAVAKRKGQTITGVVLALIQKLK